MDIRHLAKHTPIQYCHYTFRLLAGHAPTKLRENRGLARATRRRNTEHGLAQAFTPAERKIMIEIPFPFSPL
jgi:hypothetical protein